MKLGVDAGNHSIKIYGERGALQCSSLLGEYRERNLRNTLEEGEIVYEFRGRKGFAGKLAEIESYYAGSMSGTTKAHEETLIRVLIGVAQYTKHGLFQIVVGQPISSHKEEEKRKIKEMLLGDHEIIINDQQHKIKIDRIEVAAEGGVAFWSNPKKGRVRILDFGSGTVNGATLLDGKYVDSDSFTLSYGTGTLEADDTEAFVRSIFLKTQMKRWRRTDLVYVVGWNADNLIDIVQNYFQNAEILRPRDPLAEGMKILHPVYANAVGMYRVATELFK